MSEEHRRLEGLKHGRRSRGRGEQRIIQDGIIERQKELCFRSMPVMWVVVTVCNLWIAF